MDEHYDLCVIGAGAAGFAAAERARRDGRSVLIASGPGDLGGTCIRARLHAGQDYLRELRTGSVTSRARTNWACAPTSELIGEGIALLESRATARTVANMRTCIRR